MTSIADRIHVECGNVIQFFWFQFEALAPGSEFKSWWWGPGSETLEEGVPEPDRYPPALPGVHRRTPWQLIERLLRCAAGRHRPRPPPPLVRPAPPRPRARSSCSTACCRR